MSTSPRDIVLEFWRAMGTNDFHVAAEFLTEDYQGIWPQSGEVISGPADFAAVNAAYPAEGKWRFTVNRCIGDGDSVATDVTVTDGAMVATVISFHTVRGAKISQQVEYWPDPYDPPAWREKWVTIDKDKTL